MAKTNTNPEVRFAGFTEDWEERALYEVAKFNPKHEIPDIFNYVDLESVVGTEMISYRKEYKISAPSRAQRLAEKGDVFYQTVRPYQKNNLLFDRKDKDFVFSTGYAQMRPVIESSFLFTLIQKDEFVRVVLNNCTGTSYPAINSTVLASIKQYFPKSKDEQKLIGNFFENIDKLIAEHQQKHGKLKSLKQAMLDKMFPKQGQLVPEIRFKGFEGEWEEKTLKEIANEVSDGNWIESNHIFEEGEYRIIQTGNLGVGKYLDKSNTAKFFYQKDFDEVRGNEIFPGDILISRLAEPAGRTIILPATGYRMVTAVDVSIIRPNDTRFDSTFLMTQLNRTSTLNSINENVSGTSHKRISRRNLEKTKLSVPLLDEQKMIGNYFKNIDELIDNHDLQITKLQNIKKAFLAKMFI